jgi:TRAP-type C4-dicarboxylate transport system permease large subunit
VNCKEHINALCEQIAEISKANSTVLSPSWEAASRSATQEFRNILCIIIIIIIIGVGLTSPGTAATSGLLYSPRW